MFHHEFWKSIYFVVRRSKVNVTRHKNSAGLGFALLWVLVSSGCIVWCVRRPSNVRFHMRLVISVPLVASSPASSVSLSASAYRITASWNAPMKLFAWKQARHVTGHLLWRHCTSLSTVVPRSDQTMRTKADCGLLQWRLRVWRCRQRNAKVNGNILAEKNCSVLGLTV